MDEDMINRDIRQRLNRLNSLNNNEKLSLLQDLSSLAEPDTLGAPAH